ncbi:MAG: APC family permease [Terracidiphilus sp.]|jgi:amino acid transporter
MIDTEVQQHFREAEHEVERHSGELRKELCLGDIVLSQLTYIVGLTWLGTAGKLGPEQFMYWIPAVFLFYIPTGIVVVHLNNEMPLEGGLYQWSKLRFGEMIGFLVALNTWASIVLLLSSLISMITDSAAYAAGPSGAWIASNHLVNSVCAALVIGGLMALAARGLSLAKWIHNSGGFMLLLVFVGLLAFALPRWIHGNAATAPVSFVIPAVNLLNLNIAGKMAFGAFCGLEGCSVFSGEVRDPQVARTLRRAIWIAGPLIAFIYILGTCCVLAFTRPAELDLVSPAMEALSRGSAGTSLGLIVPAVAAVLLVWSFCASASIYNNAVVRLPMVAGWDHLLPAWLSRLHPRFKTPTGSIITVGAASFVLTILANSGVGAQEGFQILLNGGIIFWALTNMVMFAIPLFAPGEKPSLGVRAAALSALGMTLLYVILAIFPIIDVRNPASFTLKVVVLILGINGGGAWYFHRASRRRLALALDAETERLDPCIRP